MAKAVSAEMGGGTRHGQVMIGISSPSTIHSTMIQTHLASDVSVSGSACNWAYVHSLGAYFQDKGPWTIRSATGYVRIHFKV
jgi:hypothetical protein